jgi:hypothetical protein
VFSSLTIRAVDFVPQNHLNFGSNAYEGGILCASCLILPWVLFLF